MLTTPRNKVFLPILTFSNITFTHNLVIRAIEEQLSEILRAGETLGVNADEVLQHVSVIAGRF